MSSNDRFATLDALRGIAAIGVMLAHAFPTGRFAVTGGYLAVDLFFMLSGFVISLSYEDRMRAGMRTREFLTRRAIRLWPMVLVGASLGIALHGGHAGLLFLLPNPLSPSLLYPANPPLWSLLFEAIAYCGFALFAARLGTAGILLLLTASGGALAYFALSGTVTFVHFGVDWRTLLPGLARLTFAFALGMAIYRLRIRQDLERKASACAWIVLLAFVPVMIFVPSRGPLAAPFALASIFLVFPLLLWWGTRWELKAPRVGSWLGDLSYPLYCIHMPLLALAIAHGPARPVFCMALIAASLLLDRWWDRPARRWLSALRSSRTLSTASA